MASVASAHKIAFHRPRLREYLAGDPIFPVTLELDITSECTRRCADCPSARSDFQQSLSFGFIGNLISSLAGRTRGLLLTGGEATMSPHFPAVLELARSNGFLDIAVVTNGALLDEPPVFEALLAHASTIRLSMYDWDHDSCGDTGQTLARIRRLRKKIDSTGSALRIGISALTSAARIPQLRGLGESVRKAGAHWIYYHPMCTGWSDANLKRDDQAGVLDFVDGYGRERNNGFSVQISSERYTNTPIEFSAYHAAHFLMVVGADGINYLGAEVKYQDRFAIARFTDSFRAGDLRAPDRLAAINAVNSRTYSAINSRHRGVLYNTFIEGLRTRAVSTRPDPAAEDGSVDYRFPHIL